MDRLNRLTGNWDGLGSASGVRLERSSTADPCDGAHEHVEQLFRTIEAEIIPRLMLAHTPPAECPTLPDLAGREPDAATVMEFTRLVVEQDGEVAAGYVEALRAQGTPLETLYLKLITPAARRLGELWEADLCDFTEVTVGLWRLQQVLRGLSPAFREENHEPSNGRRMLLVPAPGEQHVLGIIIVGDYFRRAGWDVWGEPPATSDDLPNVVQNEWFDVVGLSVGCEVRVDDLAAEIRAIRQASRNRNIGVMVGGPLFNKYPSLVAQVGADASAKDGREAVLEAARLAERGARRS
jgi:MerR family transcriptional regulator, light-induced transcriptional regulator